MLAWIIACRYFFSPKSHSAINAITVVAASGVAVIAMALICTLSVYNGFEALVDGLYSNFDPDLRIEAVAGKGFRASDALYRRIADHPGVLAVNPSLEETVLLSYNGRQIPALMKGVDSTFRTTSRIDSILHAGSFTLSDPVCHYAVVGVGLAGRLGVNAGFIRPFAVYCPKREGKIDLLRPDDAFVEGELFCSGTFAVNQVDYDDRIFLTSLSFARMMLADSTLTTAYEVSLRPGVSAGRVQQDLVAALGPDFKILTRVEQKADYFKIAQIEKWITFLIILFILLIASFNIIGALSMLIIDKESEIITLRNLGADSRMLHRIFLYEGILISGSGALLGIALGIVLCLLQEHYGFISLGDGSSMFITDSYPVQLHWSDVLWSTLSVCVIGLLATIYPIRVLARRKKS